MKAEHAVVDPHDGAISSVVSGVCDGGKLDAFAFREDRFLSK
jgi:hypothetical protein